METIGNYSFNNCDGLTSINIPSTITSIGLNAFSNNEKLKYIFYEGSNTDICKSNCFENIGTTTAYVILDYKDEEFCGLTTSKLKQ